MQQQEIVLAGKSATGYVIPIGPVNLVFATGSKGLVGCGAVDVLALGNFSYPAARVRPKNGKSIESIDDLLNGIVKEANKIAEEMGITVGISGREALTLLL
jgi:uncharacterized protein YunC (DUF1805 family)